MRRILIFSLAYYPHVGGAEIALKEITDRISPEEIEFHMVTMRFTASEAWEEKIGNVHVHRIGNSASYFSKILFIIRAAGRAWTLHNETRFDVFWGMMSYMAFPIALLRIAGLRLPYVLTLQDGDPFEQVMNRARIALVRPLLSFGFRHANVVQVISYFLADWPRQLGYHGPVIVIPNGVDASPFTGEHIAQSVPTLITTSRLVHKNAIDTVIRALPLMSSVRFQILGIGPEEQRLKDLAQELGVADRVEFLGFVENAQIPDYLHHADIFIRPSRSEGMGISFIEAMAAGIPVIATQEGGIGDFLFDAKRNADMPTTGWAVDKDSPEQIAGAVEDIMAHPEQVRAVVAAAAAMAHEKYDWNLIVKEMTEKVFERILTSNINKV